MAIGTILTAIGLIKDFAPTLGKVAEKFIDGKATKEELDAEADLHELSAEVRLALAQITLNANEAKHSSIFVAGWRPFVGWTCALALFVNFIIFPFATAFGLIIPVLDVATMMPILLGMLGLGGMRSFEKINGSARSHMDHK